MGFGRGGRPARRGGFPWARCLAWAAIINVALVLLVAVPRDAAEALLIAAAAAAVIVRAVMRLRERKAAQAGKAPAEPPLGAWVLMPGEEGLRAMRRMPPLAAGPWQGYQFRLSGGYGWQDILEAAQYLIDADLRDVGTVTTWTAPGDESRSCMDEVRASGGRIDACPALRQEGAGLGVGGMSRTFGVPTKVVWYNQTELICVYVRGEARDVADYARHIVRRDFPA